MEIKDAAKVLSASLPMSPISIEIQPASVSTSLNLPTGKSSTHSPSPGSMSSITVIPIPSISKTSPTTPISASTNVPKPKINPTIKPSEISVSKLPEVTISSTASQSVPEALQIPTIKDHPAPAHGASNKSSVTITSVDLRTNNSISKDIKSNESVLIAASEVSKNVSSVSVSSNEKSKILSKPQSSEHASESTFKNDDDDCQIIDLTDTSTSVVRKPGPKSKTKYIESSNVKPVKYVPSDTQNSHKTIKAEETPVIQRKPEETTGIFSYKYFKMFNVAEIHQI